MHVFSVGNCCTTSHSTPVVIITAAGLLITRIGIWISKIDNYREKFTRRSVSEISTYTSLVCRLGSGTCCRSV